MSESFKEFNITNDPVTSDFKIVKEEPNRKALKKEIRSARIKAFSLFVTALALLLCAAILTLSLSKKEAPEKNGIGNSPELAASIKEASSRTVDINEVYNEKIAQFKDALKAENDFELTMPIEMSEHFFSDNSNGFGYALLDLNGDSENELLLGSLSGEIYNFYAFSENRLESLESCDLHERLYITKDNLVIKSNDNESFEVFEFDKNGELKLTDIIVSKGFEEVAEDISVITPQMISFNN